MGHVTRFTALFATAVVASGCHLILGSDEFTDQNGGGGDQGGAGAQGQGAATATSDGGNGADSPGGGGGSGGEEPVGCVGEFADDYEAILSEPDSTTLGSPTLTDDELEIFYTRGDGVGTSTLVRSVRGSKSDNFPPGEPVDIFGLPSECLESITMHVTGDGQRMYLSCSSPANPQSPIYLATRVDTEPYFELTSELVIMGPSPYVTEDETGLITSSSFTDGPPLYSLRGSAGEPFPEPLVVPGLENETLLAPALTPDGQTIYGHTRVEAGGGYSLAKATLDGITFIDFTLVATPGLELVGSPVISKDCRSLYFLGAPTQQGPWSIYVRHRQ